MTDRAASGSPDWSVLRRRPGGRDSQAPSGPETEAELAAIEWQIVIELRQLLAHQPSLVLDMLDELRPHQRAIAPQLLAAAREALSAHPLDAAIHERAAQVLARLGLDSAAAEIRTRAGRLAARDGGTSVSPGWTGRAPGRAPTCGDA